MRQSLALGARCLLLSPTFVFSAQASGQQLQGCEDHAQIVQRLNIKFREELSAIATNQYGWLIELYTSGDGKSWTLVATRPNGPACVFAVGQDWQMVAPIAGNPM
jgi:hypothetical protein